jgi:multiple sugar transport system substrate-binding protein
MNHTFDRRGFLRASTAAAGALLLSNNSFSQSAPVNLRIITSTPKELYDDLTARFMALQSGIKITVETPSPDYDDLTLRILRAAITDDIPDVAFQGFNRIATLVAKDVGIPLDTFVASEASWNTLGYQPTILDMTKYGPKSYGLPFGIASPTLFYNLDLVKRAGGDPDNLPATWPEIIALGKKIAALGNGTMGLHYAYIGHTGAWTWMALVMSQGGHILTPDNSDIAFNSPEGLRALELFREFGQAGQLEMSLDQTRQAFSGGTLGILGTSNSYLRSAEKAAKDHFALRTTTLPLAANGKLPVGGNAAMILTKDPDRQKAAWEFIKFMTGPEAQTMLVKTTGYIPANSIVVEKPELLGDFYKANPNAMTGVLQLPTLTACPTFPGENSIKITNIIRDHVQTVVTLKREPAEVMEDMIRDVRALMPRA